MVHSRKAVQFGFRFISTNSPKRTTVEALNISKKEAYYKTLGETDDTNPEGWDDAIPFEEVPGPKPVRGIGNTWRFLPVVGEYYNVAMPDLHKRLYKQFGSIVSMKGLLGQNDIVLLFDPQDIEQTLRNEGAWPARLGLPSFVYYRKHVRPEVFQGVGGVLTVQGEEWFKMRSVVNPILMQPRIAQQYVRTMDEVANDLIENIRHFSKNNDKSEMPDDFLNELYKWTMESMGIMAFNKRLGCLDLSASDNSEPQQFIRSVIQMFEHQYQLDVLPSLWRYVSTPTWRRYVKILDYLTFTSLKHIDEALEKYDDENKPDHEKSVLQRLAKVDKKIAIAMTMDMMIAGIDTTGRTMGAALYYLARFPEKQEQLRSEVLRNLPDKSSPVTKDVLNNSPYLKAVVKETTRMAPIAIGNLRTSPKNLVLGGYQIPKGTEIAGINLYLSNSEEHFTNAAQFIPERWLRTTEDEYSYKNVHPFVHLPFGFGPRSCVGKRLANLELEVGLCKILRNFRLSWPHSEDMKFGCKLLYGIEGPLKLKVEELEK